jgi:hypothetical protein
MTPMDRRLVLTGLAFGALAQPAWAADLSTEASSFIASIYEIGATSWPDLSRRLAALFQEDAARDPGRVDVGWLQGKPSPPLVTGLTVHTLNLSGRSSAAVEARFLNHGEERFRRFHLVRERGRWVIDDVRMQPEGVGLFELLTGEAGRG